MKKAGRVSGRRQIRIEKTWLISNSRSLRISSSLAQECFDLHGSHQRFIRVIYSAFSASPYGRKVNLVWLDWYFGISGDPGCYSRRSAHWYNCVVRHWSKQWNCYVVSPVVIATGTFAIGNDFAWSPNCMHDTLHWIMFVLISLRSTLHIKMLPGVCKACVQLVRSVHDCFVHLCCQFCNSRHYLGSAKQYCYW